MKINIGQYIVESGHSLRGAWIQDTSVHNVLYVTQRNLIPLAEALLRIADEQLSKEPRT